MNGRFIFTFVFLLSVSFLPAQVTVKGKVVESETGEPLYSSYPIFLLQKKDKGVLNISTINFDGEYKIKSDKAGPGPFILFIHIPGYKPFYSEPFNSDPDKIRFVDFSIEKETAPSVSVYHNKESFTRFNTDSGFCSTTLFIKLMKAFNDSVESQFKRIKSEDKVPMPYLMDKKPCVEPSPKIGWDKWLNQMISQLDRKSRKNILKQPYFVIRLRIGHQKPFITIESNKNLSAFNKLNALLLKHISEILPGEYSYTMESKPREEIVVKVIRE